MSSSAKTNLPGHQCQTTDKVALCEEITSEQKHVQETAWTCLCLSFYANTNLYPVLLKNRTAHSVLKVKCFTVAVLHSRCNQHIFP